MAPLPAVPGKAEGKPPVRKAGPVIMDKLAVQRTRWKDGVHNLFDHYPDSDDDNDYEETSHTVVGCGVLVCSRQTQRAEFRRPESLPTADKKFECLSFAGSY